MVIVAAAGFFFYLLRDFGLGLPALLAAAVFVYTVVFAVSLY